MVMKAIPDNLAEKNAELKAMQNRQRGAWELRKDHEGKGYIVNLEKEKAGHKYSGEKDPEKEAKAEELKQAEISKEKKARKAAEKARRESEEAKEEAATPSRRIQS